MSFGKLELGEVSFGMLRIELGELPNDFTTFCIAQFLKIFFGHNYRFQNCVHKNKFRIWYFLSGKLFNDKVLASPV